MNRKKNKTITVLNTAAAAAAAEEERNRKKVITNCTPFTNCICEINNTQTDNPKDIDIVMPSYNSM